MIEVGGTLMNKILVTLLVGLMLMIGGGIVCAGPRDEGWAAYDRGDYGRPLIMLLSEVQMSDYKGAALMLPALPKAEELLGDKGYDADWFRQALGERGITACIPSKSNRKKPIEHDRTLYRQRHKIENMFGRLKDWRRVHTRYDRCAHTFMSAISASQAPLLTTSTGKRRSVIRLSIRWRSCWALIVGRSFVQSIAWCA